MLSRKTHQKSFKNLEKVGVWFYASRFVSRDKFSTFRYVTGRREAAEKEQEDAS